MKTTKFQIIFIAIFVIFIVLGVFLFATYKGDEYKENYKPIVVWGTFSDDTFNSYIQKINLNRGVPLSITYVKKNESSFDRDFIETLARGTGPDVILLPQDMILRHNDKIIYIPFDILPEREYRDTYVEQSEQYIKPNGIMAIPFSIDPLVMYWNRDLFNNAGIATYPKVWNDFQTLIDKIGQKDERLNIRRSAVALGDFTNITNAKEVLSTLFFQIGNPIVNYSDFGFESTLDDPSLSSKTSDAINFFIKFINPQDKSYSWNRSLPQSKNAFIGGNLATYFGFASEIYDIRNKNPNIDFDVAPFPQLKDSKYRVTYGKMYGMSIVKTTADQLGSYNVIKEITNPENLSILVDLTYLPPVRRDLISNGNKDPYLSIFYDSAIVSKGWLDPNKSETNRVFSSMIDSVTSGRSTINRELKTANDSIDIMIQQLNQNI